MEERKYAYENILNIVSEGKLKNVLLNSREDNKNNWYLDEDYEEDVFEIINMIHTEYNKLDDNIKKHMKSYDGYLIHLHDGKFIRILVRGTYLIGMVYYTSEYVLRVVKDLKDTKFSCSLYKSGAIRGVDFYGYH